MWTESKILISQVVLAPTPAPSAALSKHRGSSRKMEPLFQRFQRMTGLCGSLRILILLAGSVGGVEDQTLPEGAAYSSPTSQTNWSTAFEQPDESPLMKRKLLGTIPALGKQWRVSFEVFPESFNHKGLASVLHMMTGEKANKFGKHIPAVWIHRSKAIFVSTSLGKKPTFTRRFRSKALALRTWTQIEVSQSWQGENHIYAVKIGGKQVFLTKNTRPREFYNVKVYAVSPSSSPLAGAIRNLKIEVGVEESSSVEGIFLKTISNTSTGTKTETPRNSCSKIKHCHRLNVMSHLPFSLFSLFLLLWLVSLFSVGKCNAFDVYGLTYFCSVDLWFPAGEIQ